MNPIPSLCLALLLGASLSAQAAGDGSRREMLQERMQERIKAMDGNGDGAISREEYMAHAEQQFQRLDANHDGRITQDEIGKLRQQAQQRQGGQFP
ncbi:hypothetical protein ACSC9U_08270 [Pseudomonas solani]|uniref:EF-hand domain-containing protein n=1 Tax=Pseudomonas solani TaxID=2731552 RepID=A0AAU7XX06_9PSED